MRHYPQFLNYYNNILTLYNLNTALYTALESTTTVVTMPDSTGTQSNNGNSSTVGGIVVGCVVGIIIFVITVILLVWYQIRRRWRKNERTQGNYVSGLHVSDPTWLCMYAVRGM